MENRHMVPYSSNLNNTISVIKAKLYEAYNAVSAMSFNTSGYTYEHMLNSLNLTSILANDAVGEVENLFHDLNVELSGILDKEEEEKETKEQAL